MNRRIRQRLDEHRRREVIPKPKAELNSSDASKSLMDNYFESQKIIQSLTANCDAPPTEPKITKSFRIPKKQPPPIAPGRRERNGIRRVPNNRPINDRRIPSRDERISPRRDFDRQREDDIGDVFEEELPERISPERTRETNVHDINSRIRENFARKRVRVRVSRKLADRRREQSPRMRSRSVEMKTSPIRSRSRELHRRDERPRRESPADVKRIRLDSSPNRDDSLEGIPMQHKKHVLKVPRIHNYRRPNELIITDLSSKDGTLTPENARIFLKEIEKSVAERILTDPIHQTKFLGHRFEDGFVYLTCADKFTESFVELKLQEELDLWPGAHLKCNLAKYKIALIYVTVPNSLGIRHFSELLDACQESNNCLCTARWWVIEAFDTKDETGRVYKLGVDAESAELIKQSKDKLRCRNTYLKVKIQA